MTTTTPQWTITEKDTNGKPLQIETQLGGSALYIYAKNKRWFLLCNVLLVGEYLEKANNGEQAIAEAIVIVAQRLAQLSAELSTIPLTIENQ